ncbi:MAG TPA: hypothetical protein DCZ72_02940 [Armatimonadetes bacterium]|nr:hypothetical protein [Armatimonadota bacterium]
MAALSEDTGRELRALGPITLPLATGAVLYDGSICVRDASGLLKAATGGVGEVYAGIYRGLTRRQSDGAEDAIVDGVRPYRAEIAAATQADVGKPVYLVDDNSVALAGDVLGGHVLMVISATEVWVMPPALGAA